jgi:hypothetical protein
MTRQDSIRSKGLERHVDEYCELKGLVFRYADFKRLVEEGDEFGERVPALKLARLFKTTRPTIEKWLMIYEDEAKNAV